MKKYIGKRLDDGCEVYVEEDGKSYPLPHSIVKCKIWKGLI